MNLLLFFLLLFQFLSPEQIQQIVPSLSQATEIPLQLKAPSPAHPLSETEKQYVAHAGGFLDTNYHYLNNYEAIQNSYNRGYRLIELDVEFTSDNKPVLLHSWDGFVALFFHTESFRVYSYEEFQQFQMINGWHALTVDDLIHAMETDFPEMYWITDTKNDNSYLLELLATQYPHMLTRIIPQVYSQQEYFYAKELGFENVIYTLYESNDTEEEILVFCKEQHPFAITMNTTWAYSDLPGRLAKQSIYTYAHTINDVSTQKELQQNHINGIYTDILFAEEDLSDKN